MDWRNGNQVMENTQFQTASNQSSQSKRALLGQASMFELLANRMCLIPLIALDINSTSRNIYGCNP